MSDPRNATASWSGYLHQGKVGILVALREINILLDAGNNLGKWSIKFENAEDFDIINNGKVKSRHQVKAYKDAKYPNDLKDVLSTLQYRFDEVSGKVKMISPGFKIYKYDQKGNILEIEVDDDSRYLHTITEILYFGLSIEDFKKQCNNASIIHRDNPNKIKLYEYTDTEKYCPLSTLDSEDKLTMYSIKELKKILIREDHTEKENISWQKGVLESITAELDKEIREKHIEGDNSYPEISFQKIYELIVTNTQFIKSNIQSLREKFVTFWEEFKYEFNVTDVAKEEEILAIIKTIYDYDDEVLKKFFINIHPDEVSAANFDTMSNAVDFFKKDNIKYIFLYCLYEVKNEKFSVEEICYEKDGGYVLTAIAKPPVVFKAVVEVMINNSKLTDKFFNKNFLINNKINDMNLYDEIEKNNNWSKNLPESNKFMNPNIKFISVEKAIEKLNTRGE